MDWVCIKYIEECPGHKNNKSYILPLSDVEIESEEFNTRTTYLAKCFRNKNKWCRALIAFIEKNSNLFFNLL